MRSSEDRGTGHKAGVVVGAPFWRQHAVRQTGARQRRQPLAAGGAALAGRGPRPRTGVRRPQDDRPWRAGSPLAHADLPWLALVILCGGAIALVLLIWLASLLLNLEGLATLAIASARMSTGDCWSARRRSEWWRGVAGSVGHTPQRALDCRRALTWRTLPNQIKAAEPPHAQTDFDYLF